MNKNVRKYIVEYKEIGLYAVVAVFIVDFSVALNAGQIKTGSIARSERGENTINFYA